MVVDNVASVKVVIGRYTTLGASSARSMVESRRRKGRCRMRVEQSLRRSGMQRSNILRARPTELQYSLTSENMALRRSGMQRNNILNPLV